jgi:hypothetical protein
MPESPTKECRNFAGTSMRLRDRRRGARIDAYNPQSGRCNSRDSSTAAFNADDANAPSAPPAAWHAVCLYHRMNEASRN